MRGPKFFASLILTMAAVLTLSAGCASRPTRSTRAPAQYVDPRPPADLPPAALSPELKAITSSSNQFYFDWPVAEARLVRGFSLAPTGKRRKPHLGIDLAAPKGTRILAAHDGTVVYVGREFKGYGRMILIEGKQGWATLYGHLKKSLVLEGDQVKQGDLIAQMGRTGRADGVHLHFEIRKNKGPLDPMAFLPRPSTVADRTVIGRSSDRSVLMQSSMSRE